MRRINQNYLLATQTSVNVSAVKLPENINDDYFKVSIIEKNTSEVNIRDLMESLWKSLKVKANLNKVEEKIVKGVYR